MLNKLFFNHKLKKLISVNKKLKESNEIALLIENNYQQLKNQNSLNNIIFNKSDNYFKYIALVNVLGLQENFTLKYCNYFDNQIFSALQILDKIILKYNDNIYPVKLEFDGEIKNVVYSLNKTKIYYESGGKIFEGSVSPLIDNLGFNVKGLKILSDLPLKTHGENCIISPFKNCLAYIKNKELFLQKFDEIALKVLFSEKISFHKINFEKIVNAKLPNYFNQNFSLIEEKTFNEQILQITELFCGFDYKIAVNFFEKCKIYDGNTILSYSKKNLKISPNLLNCKTKIKEEIRLNIKNNKIAGVYNNLCFYYNNIKNNYYENIKIIDRLFLLNCSDKMFSENILQEIFKYQMINGQFLSFIKEDKVYADKNDMLSLIIPIFVIDSLNKNKNILDNKIKYANIKKISANYGYLDFIYPADTIYEHIIKCLESFTFKDCLISTNNLFNIGGLFCEKYQYKNIIYTLIYLISLDKVKNYFSEREGVKFLTFSDGVKNFIKNKVLMLAFKKREEKLLLYSLYELVFKENELISTFDFYDFYSFFDFFSEFESNIKIISTETLLVFLYALAEKNFDLMYIIADEFFKLFSMSTSKIIEKKLCFDGAKFFFSGGDSGLNLLYKSFLEKYFYGIELGENSFILKKFSKFLNGQELEIKYKNKKIKIKYTNSGKNKFIVGDVSYVNVSEIPYEKIIVAKNCVIEF